ncbi:hypothetical protein FLP10_14935 [Agromyces intestinalis]|uniref:Glycoside hydrolase family 38 N-terminal domain-containing protein n=1 Tax=Agromyces intestinalis TaxID=2592652 RepID=A0A5C1YK00_9MICO|nr:hypothetical protein [Agromyces intestinalis]QEO15580.1 hypothetical protein FLP10_14935 [Agromyces intestinalis]
MHAIREHRADRGHNFLLIRTERSRSQTHTGRRMTDIDDFRNAARQSDGDHDVPAKLGWYTFGNHFHWVDMEWLWGNGVLGRSIDDMLTFIGRTGAPGNINFDGVGYEKLASEEPKALARLKDAIADGRVEVVGATYGQPYGLFHHGESAVRQLAYGVRASLRLLESRPRSFWEEEFCFFPQLPQLLRDAGYRYASLFFQWTWHTPEIPKEHDAAAIRWRGIDGSEVLALPRSELNLHQWPEDIEALIASGEIARPKMPVVQQWLELLPAPDWMCRSELVAPGVERLFNGSGVDFRTGTLSTVLDALEADADPREYGMDDVFHGMSLGKNGNRLHRLSRRLEQTLLAAETASVLVGSLGKPYAQWAKYSFWELEEAWRELLAFQHHDNDECEGLCGHIGYLGAERGLAIAEGVLERQLRRLAASLHVPDGAEAVVNTLGWDREAFVAGRRVMLPALAATVVPAGETDPAVAVIRDGDVVRLARGGFSAEIDLRRGVATRVGELGTGPVGLGGLRWVRDGQEREFSVASSSVSADGVVTVAREAGEARVEVSFRLAEEIDALDLWFSGDLGDGPDGRAHAALMTLVEPALDVATVFHDTPYAVSAVEGRGTFHRKYPTGDWMTSPQEFETVVHPFTGLQFADQVDASGTGLLWLHDGSQGFHRAEIGFWNVLSMRDPWDEEYYTSALDARVRAVPHGAVEHGWRWRRAQEFTTPVRSLQGAHDGTADSAAFARLEGSAAGASITAVYRDSDYHATGFEAHVNSVAAEPVLIRVVEFAGDGGTADIVFAERPVRAWRTTTLGEIVEELDLDDDRVAVDLRPREITTVAVEFAPRAEDAETLDDHRGTWATVHRTADEENNA